ncbi:MAG: hypothetical protein ACYCOU_20155 [Sulfobacillus sp.]
MAIKHWIPKDLKKGALHREMGVKAADKIPAKKLEAAAKKPGVEGERARFAENMKKLRKK